MSATYQKIRTGISGFDSLVNGGLKENRSIVLSGYPGTGKTIFGLQYLVTGARDFDEHGVYVSTSQDIEQTIQDVKSFGWDMKQLHDEGKLIMLDLRPFDINGTSITKNDSFFRGEELPFEHLTKALLQAVKRIKAKRVVIDSIGLLTSYYEDKFIMRIGLQAMIQTLENNGITPLLITETTNKNNIPDEFHIANGIIQFNYAKHHDVMERTIQIIKLRGINHNEQPQLIKIDENGFQVLRPRLTP